MVDSSLMSRLLILNKFAQEKKHTWEPLLTQLLISLQILWDLEQVCSTYCPEHICAGEEEANLNIFSLFIYNEIEHIKYIKSLST